MSLVRKRLYSLVLVVLLGAAGLFLFFWQEEKKQLSHQAQSLSGRLFESIDLDNLRSLGFKNASGEVVAIREEQGGDWVWRIAQPLRAEADQPAIKGILAHLARVRVSTYVGEQVTKDNGAKEVVAPTDLSIYGLDSPRYELRVTSMDGTSETLLGGSINSFNQDLFVKIKQRDAIMMVPGELEYQLDKALYDLRDKTLVWFEPKEIVELAVESGGKPLYSLKKNPQTGLFFTGSPKSFRADSQQVLAMLSDLQNTRAKTFVTDKADLRALKLYGLDKPTFRATLTFLDGTKKSILYSRVDTGNSIKEYMMREGSTQIARIVAKGLREQMVVDPTIFADTKALGFRKDRVAAVELRKDNNLVQLKLENRVGGKTNWKMLSPSVRNIRDSQVEGLLYKLETLRWVSVSDRETSENPFTKELLQARGLGPEAPTVKLLSDDGTLACVARFGKAVNGRRFVMEQGSGLIMLVNEQPIADLKWLGTDFGDARSKQD